ncbi:alpha/beta hydrolase [Kitasatospora sp. NPDC057015]|uniref:alpha/beta hydrolase n=1 Tax=Kitasatospora sp. NPDC057015 TaxID=3346001 RepID=UPI003626E643
MMIRALATWNPLDWPLTHGPVAYAVLAVGWVAVLLLAVDRGPRWAGRRLPLAVGLAVVLTVLLDVVVDDWWQPFPEGLPNEVTVWIGAAILGLCLAGFRMPRLTWWPGRALAALAAALAVLMASSQVNRQFDQYPTARVLLAPWISDTGTLSTSQADRTITAPPGKTMEEVWTPPADLPQKGTLATVRIPGPRSAFKTRKGFVYLPPAYEATPRPLLPVLVLLPGQPGAPEDWVNSGGLRDIMDTFAAAHRGLAPIVVVADPTGSPWVNQLCMDSRLAKAQTYLAHDVPAWVRDTLQTASGRKSWAVAGLSFGGTCSLQLALNAPEVFGSFINISGQQEPTLGSHGKSVKEAFGGNEAAFEAVDPMHMLARKKFPDTAGIFVVGSNDQEFRPQQEKMYAAAVRADAAVELQVKPGWHDWTVFRAAISDNLTWLTKRMGLIG